MNKRGQFFLLMAFIIIIAFVGLGTVYTYVKAPAEDYHFIDLSEQIRFEGYSVIDNGVFNTLSQQEIDNNTEYLLSTYAKANPDSDILAVYGDESHVSTLNYNEETTGSIEIATGSASSAGQNLKEKIIRRPDFEYTEEGKKIKVGLANLTYEFTLKKGQNFFLAMKKQKGDEEIVILPKQD